VIASAPVGAAEATAARTSGLSRAFVTTAAFREVLSRRRKSRRPRLPPPLSPASLEAVDHRHQLRVIPAAVIVPHALFAVTCGAGERKVLQVVRAAMGPRHDVLDGRGPDQVAYLGHEQAAVAVDALAGHRQAVSRPRHRRDRQNVRAGGVQRSRCLGVLHLQRIAGPAERSPKAGRGGHRHPPSRRSRTCAGTRTRCLGASSRASCRARSG